MTVGRDATSKGSRTELPPHLSTALTLVRAAGSIVVLIGIYYLVPLDRSSASAAVAILVAGLAVLVGLIGLQVRAIIASPFPVLRAVAALATSVPLFLLLFSGTYTVMSRLSPGDFSEPLTRTDALYFTVTVFATVGFGDITAKTEAARLVVTGQMIADLVVLGLGVKVIVGAVGRGRRRRDGGGTGRTGE
ncbi:ion channel [Actinoplanes sp. NPDC049681]|uniref:ion channel n=1 Tax=Actinoplanes sp. NPDC049681 TaxID=3363905 RepID=UPI0037A2B3EA